MPSTNHMPRQPSFICIYSTCIRKISTVSQIKTAIPKVPITKVCITKVHELRKVMGKMVTYHFKSNIYACVKLTKTAWWYSVNFLSAACNPCVFTALFYYANIMNTYIQIYIVLKSWKQIWGSKTIIASRPLSHWKLLSKLISKFMLICSFRKKNF